MMDAGVQRTLPLVQFCPAYVKDRAYRKTLSRLSVKAVAHVKDADWQLDRFPPACPAEYLIW